MRERPILFSGPMVRALLRDLDPKTQTRRLARGVCGERVRAEHCPYGQKGDRLWVRETWCPRSNGALLLERLQRPFYSATDGEGDMEKPGRWRWRPSIHMPRWASRLDLELVADARLEPLWAITEADARAEGVAPFFERFPSFSREQTITTGERAADSPYRASYAVLWDEINGDRALWKSNPWVWVIGFKRLEPAAGRAAQVDNGSPQIALFSPAEVGEPPAPAPKAPPAWCASRPRSGPRRSSSPAPEGSPCRSW